MKTLIQQCYKCMGKSPYCEIVLHKYNLIHRMYILILKLSNSTVNPTLINTHDLRYILYDVKDLIKVTHWLNTPANIESDVRSYINILLI